MNARKRNAVKAWALIGIGFGAFALMTLARKEPNKKEESDRGVTVEVIVSRKVDVSHQVTFRGRVRYKQELSLSFEERGRIDWLNPKLKEGGRIEAGEVVARLDSREREHAFQEAKAELEAELFRLEIEEGNARLARRDLELYEEFDYDGALEESLALREPQIGERRAYVALAQSKKDRAELELERCRLVAGQAYVVLQKFATEGDIVAEGEAIAQVAVDGAMEVLAWLPVEDIRGVEAAMENEVGAAVVFPNIGLEGEVWSVGGALDPETMRVGIVVSLESEGFEGEIFSGQLVEGDIQVGEVEEVVELPWECIQSDGTVKVFAGDGLLLKRVVRLSPRSGRSALVEEGLVEGEQVVVRGGRSLGEGELVAAVAIEERFPRKRGDDEQ